MNWLDGAWLTRRRVVIGAGILLALQLAGLLFLVAGTHGWITPLERPTTTDFVSFYAAGELANAGTPQLAYDQAAHLAAEERVIGEGVRYQYFNYPPTYLLLCTLLASLPYLLAFMLFESATLALYLVVATRILGDRSAGAIVVLLAFPLIFWNFGLGQNAFLTAALFGAATLAIDRRPVAAGMLFGALCYKPQFGILVPLALAAGGHWRAFFAATISTAGLILVSLALFGAATWTAFLATASESPAMYESGRILFAGMANVFGAARLLGVSPGASYGLQAVAILVAAAIVVIAWWRRLSLSTRAAALAAASVVAAPLVLLYDLMLGAVAACWLVRDRRGAVWEATALTAISVVLLDGRGLTEGFRVPIFPLAAIAVLAIAAARARREITAETGSARARRGEIPASTGSPSPPASQPR